MKVILGASKHAREVEWLIHDLWIQPVVFVVEDGNELVGKKLRNRRVISEKEFMEYQDNTVECFIAVGDSKIRQAIEKKIRVKYRNFPVLVHPSVSYDKRADRVSIGEGSIIFAKSVMTTDIKIGRFVNINLGCSINHDARIGDYVTLSPGVTICGNVDIGEGVFVGARATIIDNIDICSSAKVGAGAVVTEDINEPGLYLGVPAKKIC